MPDPAPPPDDEGDPERRPLLRGWGGCLLWGAAFLFVVVAGCSIGLVLRPEPEGSHTPKTAATGDGWSLRVRIDEADDPCTDLFSGPDPVTGQCGYVADGAYRITSVEVDGRFIAFAPAPEDAAGVRVTFADGTEQLVPTDRENGVTFFVVEHPVDVDGPATPLDEDGEPVDVG